jgi:rhodanese-related sulfurtransferase
MPNKLKISSASLVAKARREIIEIDANKAIGMVGLDDVVIVDIRDFRERQRTGYIRDSFHCPRGMAEFWVDPESPYFKPVFDGEKTFLFYCASGWRSALTVATLQKMGIEKIAHVTGGFSSWIEAGGEIIQVEENNEK